MYRQNYVTKGKLSLTMLRLTIKVFCIFTFVMRPVRGANPDRPRDKQNTVWVFIGIIDESLLQHFVSNEIYVSARIKIV